MKELAMDIIKMNERGVLAKAELEKNDGLQVGRYDRQSEDHRTCYFCFF